MNPKTISLTILWLTCSTCFQLAAQGEEQPPNFIFIMADDLGWADVDFHGGNTATPELSDLLEQGVELRQHYVAPVCSPTRTGLLTGRYWSRFGITTPTNTLALPMNTVTLATALQDAGYDTCLTGKWHLGSLPKWGPNHFGFDHSYGSMAGGVTPWSHFYKKGPYTTTWHRNEKRIAEEGHVTDLIAAEAIGWLKNRKTDKPFFLYVPFTAVHLPLREPEAWVRRVPAEIKGEVARQYAASVMHLDDAVGGIVATVDEMGMSENTLIVFTSDNGGSTAENNDTKYPDDKCPNGRLPGNNLPLRGKKGDLYEGGVRVPTIVRWKGRLKGGSKIETPVHITDWMPTFCNLAKSKATAKSLRWDGDNIWPAIVGEKISADASLATRSIYSAGVHFRSHALRKGDWKLITFGDKAELYHLAKDPNEKKNLAKTETEKLNELQTELSAAMKSDRDSVAKQRK